MAGKNIMPRLNQGDVRGLGRAAKQLAAIAGTLRQSSWGAAPAVLVNVEQVYEEIAPIYNKGEPFLPEFSKGRLGRPPIEPPREDEKTNQLSLEAPAAPAEPEA